MSELNLTPEEQHQQELYRDARITGKYDDIWQSTGKCVFCDLRDKYILLEENGMVLTVSLFAYTDGHLMIIPRRHISAIKDLTPVEWDTVRKFSYLAKKMFRKIHGIHAMQILVREGGAAAQGTVNSHLHIHAIPFADPNLSTWNFRQLKYTPLESAGLYRQAAHELAQLDTRFDHKYQNRQQLPIVCDLILINTRHEVLFQERPAWAKIGDNRITMPGGSAEHFDRTLEEELAREVQEETGLTLDPTSFQLVASRTDRLTRHRQQPALDLSYPYEDLILWNTYVLTGFDPATPMQAADDAEALIWVPLAKVPHHPRISEGVKAAIAQVKL